MKKYENARTWRVKGSGAGFRPVNGWPNTTERTVKNYGQLFFAEKQNLFYTEGEYINGHYVRKYYRPENIEFR